MARAPTHPLSPARDLSACLSSRDPVGCNTQASLPFAVSRRLPREWVGCLEICFSESHSLGQALKGGAGPEPVGPICSLPSDPGLFDCVVMTLYRVGGMVCNDVGAATPSGLPAGPEAFLFLPSWKKSQNCTSKKKKKLRKEKHKQRMCQIAKGIKDQNTASKVTWA